MLDIEEFKKKLDKKSRLIGIDPGKKRIGIAISDENKKKSYRSFNQIDKKLEISTKDLIILESDTENIIDFVEYKNNKKTEKYSFWELLYND